MFLHKKFYILLVHLHYLDSTSVILKYSCDKWVKFVADVKNSFSPKEITFQIDQLHTMIHYVVFQYKIETE